MEPQRELYKRGPWGNLGWGAAEGVEEAVVGAGLVGDDVEAKVRDLEVAAVIEEEVLEFEVVMEDATGIVEGNGRDKLLKVVAGSLLLEAALGDLREELATADVPHDKVDLGLGGHHLKELDNVWVADILEDGNLALGVGDEAALQTLLLILHFDRHAVSYP